MKKLLFAALPLLLCGAAQADVAETEKPEIRIAEDPRLKSAVKSVWAKDLKRPQGMAWLGDTLYVAEYNGGQVSKWSRDGQLLGAITGLNGPAWVENVQQVIAPEAGGDDAYRFRNDIWISERKANRVLRLLENDKTEPIGEEIVQPLGTASGGLGTMPIAIAHTTSRVMQWDGKAWKLLFAPEGDGAQYGYRNALVDGDGIVYISDEEEGEILMVTPAGRAFVVARGLKDPSAIVAGPDNAIYVCEEGAGRIVRLNRDGSTSPIVDGLGAPRDIEFLDDKTALVSDAKGGVIWKVVWP